MTIHNVRGLTDLHLEFDGKNVVILGPNGAGKSGVVDAIDFLFTGRISRLTGEGTAGISLSRHGPHIDHEPDSAMVSATVQLNGIHEPVELTRFMSQSDQVICSDNAEEPLTRIRDLMLRGGVILTRRDILRFVAAEAGKRADEIEQLLHLNDVDDLRTSFGRARTELERKKKAAKAAIKTAEAEVNVTLDLDSYSTEGLLAAVNVSRQTLGGGPLDVLESNSFQEGIAPPSPHDTEPTPVNFNLIQQAIQVIRREAPTNLVPKLIMSDELLRTNIKELQKKPTLLAEIEHLELVQHASCFIEDTTLECPVCGATWPEGSLKSHLDASISAACAAQAVLKGISESAEAIATPTRTLSANVKTLTDGLGAAGIATGVDGFETLETWLESLTMLLAAATNPIEHYVASGVLGDDVARLFAPPILGPLLSRIEVVLQDTLPKPTPEQTSWDKLTKLKESVRALENRIQEQETVELHSKRSRILFAEYEKSRDAVLKGLYSRISERFVQFYKILHSHEGNYFGATLRSQGAGLVFDVDFLGRGTHPPHALHSEGHQDSMGICLFLALNEELVREELGLIVLDDVMMSVDTGHRKDVCRLLSEQFSDCQFVITTHDRTWAKQLKQENVVETHQVVEFTAWTVEGGPNTHRQLNLWETIQSHLDREDVNGAAFRLRRGSEDFFEDACSALGAQITYNSAMQWQLDDWLPAAMDQYKDLIKRGRRVASSWNDNDAVISFDELESVRKQIYGRTFVEQWAINDSVHYNNWSNMSREDLSPVVDAFRDLQGLFECSSCGGLLERWPRKGRPQVAKCPCGILHWNLEPPSKAIGIGSLDAPLRSISVLKRVAAPIAPTRMQAQPATSPHVTVHSLCVVSATVSRAHPSFQHSRASVNRGTGWNPRGGDVQLSKSEHLLEFPTPLHTTNTSAIMSA